MVQSPCWDGMQSTWKAAGAPRCRVLGGRRCSPCPSQHSPPTHGTLPCWRKPRPQAASCPWGEWCHCGGVAPQAWGLVASQPYQWGTEARPALQPASLPLLFADAWSSTASSPSPQAPSPPTRSCGGCKCAAPAPFTLLAHSPPLRRAWGTCHDMAAPHGSTGMGSWIPPALYLRGWGWSPGHSRRMGAWGERRGDQTTLSLLVSET